MTYTIAKLRVWNPAAYSKSEIREAVVFILGCMSALREDVDQATSLL